MNIHQLKILQRRKGALVIYLCVTERPLQGTSISLVNRPKLGEIRARGKEEQAENKRRQTADEGKKKKKTRGRLGGRDSRRSGGEGWRQGRATVGE